MASHGDDPRYLTFYIRLLLSRNEIREAELWFDRLPKIAAREIATLALATEIQFARERFDEIPILINRFLSNSTANDGERLERTQLAAQLLEACADRLKKMGSEKSESAAMRQEWAARFSERTDALYRDYTEERPQESLALAAFYGRQGRHTESLDILEKNWDDAKPEAIANVTATLAKSAAATKEHFARAAKVLEAALEKHERPLVLLLALANLQNWGEKFADAERLYREALEKDGKNPGTLNNLALLLALRGRGGREPLSLIDKAIAIAGPNPGLLDSRATIYLLQGDPRHAADDLAKALLRRPSAAGYFRQAQAELRLGHKESARESFAKAGEMGLKTEELHPLERPFFRQLQTELQ
jgi:Flp pilus assembly protein TadD